VSYALAGIPPRGHRDGAIAAMLAAAQGEPCNQIPARSAHRGLLERALHPDPARRPTMPAVQYELNGWLAATGQQPDGPITERLHRAPQWPTEDLP
ncbi:MAG: serine/threonine protein kinase, partial [Pseudonocardiaceae bacterium]